MSATTEQSELPVGQSEREEADSGQNEAVLAAEDWEIPGRGDSHADCGTYRPAGVCENGHADYAKHNCERRSCPRCRAAWTHEAAVSATERIQGRRLREPPNHRRQVAHCVYSPPPGTVKKSWDGVKEMMAEGTEFVEEKGLRGYFKAVHLWRLTDEAKLMHEQADTDLKEWMWLIKEAEISWHEGVEWGPHVHFVGLTSPDMDPREADDDAYYELKRTLEPLEGYQDSEAHKDVYGLVRYLLSHVSYPEGYTGQAYTWHGEMANNVFVDDARQDWQTEKPYTMQSGELEAAIRRAVGDDPDGGDEDRHHETCQHDGCEAAVVPVSELERYIRRNEPPPEIKQTMIAVLEWADYRSPTEPPPGAMHPRSIDEFQESVELVEDMI